jgi:hypothetical protein
MSMLEYIIVYDFVYAFPWALLLWGIPTLVCIIATFYARFTPFKESKSLYKWLGDNYLQLVLLPFFFIPLIVIIYDYNYLRQICINKSYSVIEGLATGFEPYTGSHRYEEFKVDTVVFRYSDGDLTGGFNQTKSNGGPMAEGKQVRISYTSFKNSIVILKLEIKK